MPARRLAATAATLCVLLAAAWLMGFLWFVHGALRTAPSSVNADGIVVLTGGADRIAAGVRLLFQDRGRMLLISGVGRGAGLDSVLRGSGLDPAQASRHVTLGRNATSTIGNAEETATWAHEHHLRTLLVVTASYHMQRALREIGRAAPDLTLYPQPVTPPALRAAGSLSTMRLLAGEYSKFLISAAGLTRLEAE